MNQTKPEKLYSLIPLDEFKALMGIDSREDKTARFCLLTATLSIEQYCKRKFLRKKYIEDLKLEDDLVIPLREYPVTEILAVFANNRQFTTNKGRIIEPEFYRPMIWSNFNEDTQFDLLFSPALKPYRYNTLKVFYWAGYSINNEQLAMSNDNRKLYVPTDLAAACMELAAWNMNRYRGRRIGMTGNIKGAGIQGEHFELSMPENRI